MKNSIQPWLANVTLLLIVFTVGCSGGGPPVAPVEGTVKLKDAPVNGVITFQSEKTGKIFVGVIDEGGSFKIDEAEIGDYKVLVTPPEITEPPEGPQDMKLFSQRPIIPQIYGNLASTDLVATVEADKVNSYTFTLKQGRRRRM